MWPEALRLEWGVLNQIFPFHVALDEGGKILGLGSALERVVPDLAIGRGFDECFEVVRPVNYSLEPQGVRRHARTLFRVRVRGWSLELRGQFVPLEAPSGAVCFVASPVAADGGQLKAAGLRIQDFAPHDSAADLLVLLQTQRVALEDAQSLARELHERTEEVRRTRAEATHAKEAKNHLLSMMSQEIRAPLSGISGMLDILSRSNLDEDQRQSVEVMRSCGDTLGMILSDILDYTKIESGRVDLDVRRFDLPIALRQVASLFVERAEEKGLELEVVGVEGVPRWVSGDSARLRQILSNLLTNAIKFTDSGRVEVRVGARLEGAPRITFEVEDTGYGIDPDAQERLFLAFSNAEPTATRRLRGTGLGLAIGRELARLMGGDLRLVNSSPAGSTFALELPMPLADSEHDPADEGGGGPGEVAGLRVLVAEDNSTNRFVIGRMLDRLGVEHLLVENGREAVDTLARGEFDLVLMDVQMPVLDGLEATSEIRAGEGAASRTPILALTANAESEDRERALAVGMDEVLVKPIRLDTLALRLGHWARCGTDVA